MSEQITAGKGRLRQQIKELETELEVMRKAPIKMEAERLAKENTQLRERMAQVEDHATKVIEGALALAKLVTAPFTNGAS